MSRLPHIVRRCKKGKTLAEPTVISREAYEGLEMDARLELIRALIPIGLAYVQEELEREVINLAGPRYSRKSRVVGFHRHGTNPGSVKLAGRKVPVRVPRVRDPHRGPLSSVNSPPT